MPPETEESNDSIDTEYILLYEVAEDVNFREMDNPDSVAAQLARGAGAGKLTSKNSLASDGGEDQPELVDFENTEATNSASTSSTGGYEDRTWTMEFQEGTVTSKSNYKMKFIPGNLRDIPPLQIQTIPDLRDYPVPKETLTSLPSWAIGELHSKGFLQITAEYDRTTGSPHFQEVWEGWVDPYSSTDNLFARFLELYEETENCDLKSIFDYLLYTEESYQWRPEKIAEFRDVGERAIKKNIDKVEEDTSNIPI